MSKCRVDTIYNNIHASLQSCTEGRNNKEMAKGKRKKEQRGIHSLCFLFLFTILEKHYATKTCILYCDWDLGFSDDKRYNEAENCNLEVYQYFVHFRLIHNRIHILG